VPCGRAGLPPGRCLAGGGRALSAQRAATPHRAVPGEVSNTSRRVEARGGCGEAPSSGNATWNGSWGARVIGAWQLAREARASQSASAGGGTIEGAVFWLMGLLLAFTFMRQDIARPMDPGFNICKLWEIPIECLICPRRGGTAADRRPAARPHPQPRRHAREARELRVDRRAVAPCPDRCHGRSCGRDG
jgi:hypothetical protein